MKSMYSVLQVAFIFCKLAGVTAIANWSWWAVFSPTILITVVFIAIVSWFVNKRI